MLSQKRAEDDLVAKLLHWKTYTDGKEEEINSDSNIENPEKFHAKLEVIFFLIMCLCSSVCCVCVGCVGCVVVCVLGVGCVVCRGLCYVWVYLCIFLLTFYLFCKVFTFFAM